MTQASSGPEMTVGLFPAERQQMILALTRRQGRVDVSDLSQRFGVTTETIRRDLGYLEQRRALRRVHGGAVVIPQSHFVPDLHEREVTRAAEKRAIARRAMQEVPMDGAVLIDSGTTCACLAEMFPADRDLTIVTNSLPIAQTLLAIPRLTILHVGGRVRPQTSASVDGWALHALSEIAVDVLFLASYGVSVRRGLTTPDPSEGAVKRAMVAAARRVVVLADHSKLGAEHLSIVGPLSAVDLLITDSLADDQVVQELTEAGLRVESAVVYPDSSGRHPEEREPG
jgi:DeoR family fructose operon transcriptional repressor